MNRHRNKNNSKGGFVMVITLAIVFIVSLIGTSLYQFSKTDVDIITNQIASAKAYNNASAGVRYAIRVIENRLERDPTLKLSDLQNMSMALPTDNASVSGTFNGFSTIDKVPLGEENFAFSFVVTGKYENAETGIQVTFKREPVFALGIFGDLSVNLQPGGTVYSYNSANHDADYTPSASDSTGEADTGSNNEVAFRSGVVLDGQVALGKDSNGDQSECDNCDSREVIELDEAIDADPLGINKGDMSAMFDYVRGVNNNSDVTGSGISDTGEIRVTNNDIISFTAGNYYVTDFSLRGEIEIDTTDGPVNIFLEGGLKFWPSSSVNVTGKPTDFMIFSNSSEDITILPNSSFKGIVIAPNAGVKLFPRIDFYGTVWSRQARIQPNGNIYIDTSLQSRLLSNELDVVSWKELRDI